MLRQIIAVMAGAALAVLLIAAFEWAGHQVYPGPEDLDWENADVVASYIASLPAGAFLFVLGGWGMGALCGGILAALLAREKPLRYATIIGVLVTLGAVATLVALPHPAWFSVTAIGVIAAMTFLATWIAAMFLRNAR